MQGKNVYIISGARTPLGSFMGSLSSVAAPQLGAVAIEGALKKAQLSQEQIQEVYMGQVIQAGVGQAPARQAALAAGLSEATPCTTVNKVCGSGLQAIVNGASTIALGENNLVVSGGMESMSLAPHFVYARAGIKFGSSALQDAMSWDGLRDAYTDRPMGNCAEECVQKYKWTREEQDEFSMNSFRKAQKAISDQIFAQEINPVTIKTRKGDSVISQDEGPGKANFEKTPQLRPAFIKDGTITAANASTINDGAAALILAGEEFRDRAEFRIRGWGKWAQNPTWFSTAPVESMKKACEHAGVALNQIDLFEINEAFAVVTMTAIQQLELPAEKVNIYGGAISLGHPIGCSGARIVVTLMNAMKQTQSRLGMASLCIGGGEGLSMVIERL